MSDTAKLNLDYFLAWKPYGVLTKFSDREGRRTLADLDFRFPRDVYPVGRLDLDSEGLLLLTNDRGLTERLLNPKYRHEREYWVQVDGDVGSDALDQLEAGVVFDGRRTLPAKARRIEDPGLPPRDPPIRFRKTVPTSWISLTIVEGRNRQVRRMTAAVGHPTLRLIRARIANLSLEGLTPSGVRRLTSTELAVLRRAIESP